VKKYVKKIVVASSQSSASIVATALNCKYVKCKND